jgi:predicted dehydrogenase
MPKKVKVGFIGCGGIPGYWVGGMPGVWWWRRRDTSGGQAVEQTIHLFDLARYLFGEAVKDLRVTLAANESMDSGGALIRLK